MRRKYISSEYPQCYCLAFGLVFRAVFLPRLLPNMSSSGDYQLAACAAGFSLGFGYLTTVRALHQTRVNRNPLRSAYIYMIWGEIIANLVLGVLCWLWLKDIVHNGYADFYDDSPSPSNTLQTCLTLLHSLFLCFRGSVPHANHHQSHLDHFRAQGHSPPPKDWNCCSHFLH